MFIIISILVLGFLIIVHELGHFSVAKAVGIRVEEFSIGFGPRLLGFKPRRDETSYSFRLLPLGGYVRMAGMEPHDEDPKGFNKKPWKHRLAVIAAGSLSNFLTAILLFIIVFSFIGVPAPSGSNAIGEVIPGSPAAQVGLQAGDRIIQVNGTSTPEWNDVASGIHRSQGQPVRLVVKRGEERRIFYVNPKYDPKLKIQQIGIRQGIIWEKQGFFTAVKLGLDRAWGFSKLILAGILGMITGSVPPSDIAGPVGITQMIGDAVRGGMGYLLTFTAILGINLALVNLLPIPALDGSRLLFLCIEGLRGKPIDPEKENFVHLIGFALLMVLFILITYNDLVRILSGG